MAHRPPSLIALYRAKVWPLLKGAGFTGTAARCERRARSQGFIVRAAVPRNATDKAAEIVMTIEPMWTGDIISERVRAKPAERDVAIKRLAAIVRKAIRQLDALPQPASKVEPAALDKALRTLLEAMPRAKFKPRFPSLRITQVEEKGRLVSVVCKGRKGAATSDRTALLMLVRELWGERSLVGTQDPRFQLSYDLEDELVEYVAQLRAHSFEEAQALFVHFFGPDMGEHPRLPDLFPKPLLVATRLNEAYSGGALVKRAIPYALKGTLLERVGAIHVLNISLNEAWLHRDAEALLGSVRALAARLVKDKAPLLRECGWLLGPMLQWCEQRRQAARA